MKRPKIILLLAVVIAVVVGAGLHYAWELISIGVAYKAKVLCSGVFVSKRSPESVLNSDLAVDDLAILRRIDAKVDRTTLTVSSSFLGLISQTAAYRQGLGCTLVFADHEKKKLGHRDAGIPALGTERSVWPVEPAKAEVAGQVDQDLLEASLDWAFSEPDPEHLRRTRAVVIVHNGEIVGERYAPGFDKNTPLLGWSMTKSVMNALVGVLIGQGKLSLTDQVHMSEWQGSNNGRTEITLNHLLQMSSGLDFMEDNSDPLADATRMLSRVPDMATYAARKKLVAKPGSRWSYSSGTTNIT